MATAALARLTSPLAWRLPGRAARKLHSFALAEEGSKIDLMLAARATPCPRRAASYLHHASDESRHARMFAQHAAALRRAEGRAPLPPVRADVEHLFDRLGELLFVAFVHRGERRGRAQFEAYRDWFAARGDRRARVLFERVLTDERRHEAYTWQLLVELAGDERGARAALRRAARWEAWRRWRRLGRALVHPVHTLSTWGVVLLASPMVPLVWLLRPVRGRWTLPER